MVRSTLVQLVVFPSNFIARHFYLYSQHTLSAGESESCQLFAWVSATARHYL
jgi:hypothetical protein